MWDIDGTLLASPSDRADLFLEVMSAQGSVPDSDPPPRAGKTDRRIVIDYLDWAGRGPGLVDAMLASLDDVSEEHFSRHPRQLIPGAKAALELARRLGAVNVLLTGNTPRRARVKLSTAGLDLGLLNWEDSAFGDKEADRHALAEALSARFPNSELTVVGDTDSDESAAREIGAVFIRVRC
jgi:phosphoglycolate phosphatase-like HAD superfamily hydrolase